MEKSVKREPGGQQSVIPSIALQVALLGLLSALSMFSPGRLSAWNGETPPLHLTNTPPYGSEDDLLGRGAEAEEPDRDLTSELGLEPSADTPSEPLPETEDNGGLRVYGFGRGDVAYSTRHLNHNQAPFFVPSGSTGDNFTTYARLSRIGAEYSGQTAEWFGQPTLRGVVEFDFYQLNPPGNETAPVPRVRHGYGEATWDEFSLLVGQYWDVIGPLFPNINDDALMWNAGNLGDRRPQVRLTWDWDQGGGRRMIAAGALGLTGAIDAQDLDGDGIRDGEQSGVPGFQSRIGWVRPIVRSEQSVEYGVWGFVAFEKVTLPVAGKTRFVSRGLGMDWILPLTDQVTVRGETFYGLNLSDFRGGIVQGVNPVTGQEVESWGGWTEVVLRPRPWYQLAIGGTLDNPTDRHVVEAGRTKNSIFYIGNRFLAGGGLTFALEWEHWNTQYRGVPPGHANRFKFWLMQTF